MAVGSIVAEVFVGASVVVAVGSGLVVVDIQVVDIVVGRPVGHIHAVVARDIRVEDTFVRF